MYQILHRYDRNYLYICTSLSFEVNIKPFFVFSNPPLPLASTKICKLHNTAMTHFGVIILTYESLVFWYHYFDDVKHELEFSGLSTVHSMSNSQELINSSYECPWTKMSKRNKYEPFPKSETSSWAIQYALYDFVFDVSPSKSVLVASLDTSQISFISTILSVLSFRFFWADNKSSLFGIFFGFWISRIKGRPFPSVRTSTSSLPDDDRIDFEFWNIFSNGAAIISSTLVSEKCL